MTSTARAWTTLAAIACWILLACLLLGESLAGWGYSASGVLSDLAVGLGAVMSGVADLLSWLPWPALIFFVAACVLTWLSVLKPQK